ncbi:unnamed protein product [Ranitomeya imitator]|uniref:Uncharacterized protein n=1 Tax=Ranitomeya imitator TaxID=111125 RepID=A0ABN9LCF8_9NEOB|nr:unnamed protein product [Ranitomeya imitator]
MLKDVAGSKSLSTASPDSVTSVTCAQCEPAFICEKHRAPVVNLPILVFCEWYLVTAEHRNKLPACRRPSEKQGPHQEESTSAETKEPSIKDQLKSFGETVKAAATSVGEQTKAAFEKLHNSEFATSARKIFSDGIEKIKNKFSK